MYAEGFVVAHRSCYGTNHFHIGGTNESVSKCVSANLLFKKQWVQTLTCEVTSEDQETLLLWKWLNTGTGCSERLWGPLPCTHLKGAWMWSQAACSKQPCLSRGGRQDDLERSLPTSVTLWFCKTFSILKALLILSIHLSVVLLNDMHAHEDGSAQHPSFFIKEVQSLI